MAHECLQRPGIDSTACKGVPGSVPQHVSVDREWQLSGHAKPFYQLLRAVDGKRPTLPQFARRSRFGRSITLAVSARSLALQRGADGAKMG
jgi:hypothetical protein